MVAVTLFFVVFALWTGILVGSSLLIVYPVFGHARNVLYVDGVVLLAAALLFLTGGAVVESAFWSGAVREPHAHLIARTLITASGITLAAAMWLFARPFVRTGPGAETSGGPGDGQPFPGFEWGIEDVRDE